MLQALSLKALGVPVKLMDGEAFSINHAMWSVADVSVPEYK